ncbi:MAG: DUF2812 domain-containing protein [Oscillospiraceae bacterium]|nr:DUF2812 domain-containing protein [Oscillospiraceae bacterium]
MKNKTTKTSYRAYFAWNYQKELKALEEKSREGWQLVKGGCFHSKYTRDDGAVYRYALDYNNDLKPEDMARYRETFEEQGWEYISSTFNGWHYFRKAYDPALQESAYEIYTDDESLRQMQDRWRRLALVLCILDFGAVAANFQIFFTNGARSATLVIALLGLALGLLLLYGWYRMGRKEY